MSQDSAIVELALGLQFGGAPFNRATLTEEIL